MIRNHLLDPEGSPSKQAGWVPPSYQHSNSNSNSNNLNINTNDDHDPWYSSSSNPSPTSNHPSNNNNYNFQGSCNGYSDSSSRGYDNSEPRLSQVMEDYDNEPPLLEELGIIINNTNIINTTKYLYYYYRYTF